jgi:cytochrome c biogenesis protein CcdA
MDLLALAKSMNIPLISALLLGLMAAIGPCTLATNIAALAYISRKITDRKYAVITASLYTLGRMFTYTAIGILIIAIGINTPAVSNFVQEFGTWVLGPFLIVVGVLLLFIDRISFGQGGNRLADMGSKVSDWGMVGGFPLGAIFALAFCPYSAVLFFMVMIPMALKTAEGIMLPAMFAIGTGLPVIIFGVLLSLGVAGTAGWVEKIAKAEKVVRIFVAIAFICVGIYYIIQLLPIFQPSSAGA